MFDRITVAPSRPEPYAKTVNVHEHRAPTDESVTLLREMERAVEERRIGSFHLEGNDLNGTVEALRCMTDQSVIFMAVFDLNGRRITVKHQVHDHIKPIEMMHGLRDAIAERLAVEIIEPSLNGLVRSLPGF